MQQAALVIANELAALPVLQAAVNAFVQAVGAEPGVARQMELVVEELITNIIKFEYLPGQQESIEVDLSTAGQQLEVKIRFKGIPFDIGYLQRCEQVRLEDILEGEARGIGLFLVRQFCDQVQYSNLGKHGQQITILRRLNGSGATTAPEPIEVPAEMLASRVQLVIRRMLPEESATVSKLAYFAYDYTYVYEHIYDPEQVRSLNSDERLISYVATSQDSQEIIGHCALLPDQRSGLDELGVAFVNPGFRGGGCLNDLSRRLISEAQARGAAGVFVVAVTTHRFSQKAAIKHDLREAALLVSRVQPIEMRAIHEQALARESLLFMVRLFDQPEQGLYHPPLHHRPMLMEICTHLGIAARFADASEAAVLPEQGELEQEVDHYLAGHIHLLRYGRDSLPRVQQILRGWCLDRLETIYLYLPLNQPPTATWTESFEKLGFFFCGLQPGRAGNHLLVLQYLNNQRYDYSALQAATPFGERLIEYVRCCDPIASFEETT